MAENLAVDDGDDGIIFNKENGEYYYTWDAAVRVVKSIIGWHLPTALEWNEAALACGAKEKPSYDSSPGLKDYTKVEALKRKLKVKLSGYRSSSGQYYDVDRDAYFWTGTVNSSTYAYYRDFDNTDSLRSDYSRKSGAYLSVRLVKD